MGIRQLLALVAIAGFCCFFASIAAEYGGGFLLGMITVILAVATLLISTIVFLLGACGLIGRRK